MSEASRFFLNEWPVIAFVLVVGLSWRLVAVIRSVQWHFEALSRISDVQADRIEMQTNLEKAREGIN